MWGGFNILLALLSRALGLRLPSSIHQAPCFPPCFVCFLIEYFIPWVIWFWPLFVFHIPVCVVSSIFNYYACYDERGTSFKSLPSLPGKRKQNTFYYLWLYQDEKENAFLPAQRWGKFQLLLWVLWSLLDFSKKKSWHRPSQVCSWGGQCPPQKKISCPIWQFPGGFFEEKKKSGGPAPFIEDIERKTYV